MPCSATSSTWLVLGSASATAAWRMVVCETSQSTARRAEICRSVLASRNSASASFASSSLAATCTTGATAPCTR